MLNKLPLLLLVTLGASAAYADTIATYNFDSLPTGPSLFVDVPAPQTIIDPGVVTFTGGVVLGDASNLPGQQYATPPNAYGTAGFANGTPNLITMTIDPSFSVGEVSFALLNGQTIVSSYQVSLFTGSTLDSQTTFANIPSNLDGGYVLPDLFATDITSVTITSLTPDSETDGYDFFIDSVAFNESIGQEINGTTPEPGSLLLLGTGALGLAQQLYRRRRAVR